MSELRRDPLERRWVVIAPERGVRPLYARARESVATAADDCPFCPGREAQTLAEICALREPASAPDGPGWRVRVVPNRYPALRIEGDLARRADGLCDRVAGVGAHEVIIETPEHALELDELPRAQLRDVLLCLRDRRTDLYRDPRLRCVVWFRNRGFQAGSSVPHPHSQLLALPEVPTRLRRRLKSSRAHRRRTGRCLTCDLIAAELDDGRRIVRDAGGWVTWAPYASRFPFELSIAPRSDPGDFAALDAAAAESLADALQDAVRRVRAGLGDPDYNLVLHAAPRRTLAERDGGADFHWQFLLFPRLMPIAGFEWGTDDAVNATPPEEAARHLRSAAAPTTAR